MALICMDGFANNNVSRWTPNIWNWLALSSTPRTAGGYYGSTGANFGGKLFAASAEIYVGYGLYVTNWPVAVGGVCSDGNTVQQLLININASGYIYVTRGGVTIATATHPILFNTWNYIEYHAKISDSDGIFQLRFNGSADLEIDFTGDTRNGGASTLIDCINIAQYSSMSDLYVCDTSGSVNNSWLGDVVVKTLYPTGAGNSTQLTPSSGANYTTVDEIPPSDSDYNGHVASGNKDTYAFSNLPAGATNVYGVQVCARMAKSDSGAKGMNLVTRSGGTDYAPTTRTLSTSYQEFTELKETDPATGSLWTPSGVNAAEFGVQVA